MVANVVLLWAYTASCHSCRHIIGGRLRSFSRYPMRYKAWTFVSKLNTKHMQLAWTTLGHAHDHRRLHRARVVGHHLGSEDHQLE